MFVYDTGRNLLAMGVVPLDNMHPEADYIKLGWTLGQASNHQEVIVLMQIPINDETTKTRTLQRISRLSGRSPVKYRTQSY